MALFNNGVFAAGSPVRAAFDDLSDQQILEQNLGVGHRIPSCPVDLPRGIAFNATATASAQRRGETLDDCSYIEDTSRAFILEADPRHVEEEDEVFIVESPKAQPREGNNTGIRARYKGKDLSADGLHHLATEDAAQLLVGREYDPGCPKPSGLLEYKDTCRTSFHSSLARHSRDVAVMPAGDIPASAGPAAFMPKLLPADLWYRPYCPERKQHERPTPPIFLPQAEVFDLTSLAIGISPVTGFSATNLSQVIPTTLTPDSQLVQPSTASEAGLKTVTRRTTKRASKNSDPASVTVDNDSQLIKAISDAKAAVATMRAERKRPRGTGGDSQRHSGQTFATSQATQSHKFAPAINLNRPAHNDLGLPRITAGPITARDEKVVTRAADKDFKRAVDQALDLPSRPIISLKRKRLHELPDDKYSDLPFRTLHNLLKMIQKNIEEAIFFFIKKWCPDYLLQRGWVVPEQGELTISSWWRALKKLQVPKEAVDFDDINFEDLYARTTQIRHAAVHRLEVSNVRLRQHMIPDAIRLVHGLKDTLRKNELREIQWIFTRGENNEPDLQALQQFLGMEPEQAKQPQTKPSMPEALLARPPFKRARIEEPAPKHIDAKEPPREYIIIEDDDPILEFIDLTQDTDEDVGNDDIDEDDQNSDKGNEEANEGDLEPLYRGLLQKLD